MKILGATHKGIEEIAALEVKEILGCDTEIVPCGVIFDCDIKDACFLAYRSQSLRRVAILKGEVDLLNLDSIKELDFSELSGKTFALRCMKAPGVTEKSTALERTIGGEIKELTGSEVDLSDPEVLCFGLVDAGKALVGIDLCGFDLAKRDYNIFSVQRSLKGDIGYALFRMVWDEGVFLDPFCGSGVVAIEAALYLSRTSPHLYAKDKFIFPQYELGFDADELFDSADGKENLNGEIHAYEPMNQLLAATKKNAKIAGVDKNITFSRMDTDWIDTKFEQDTVNSVASYVPGRDDPKSKKSVKELLDVLSLVLVPKGKAILLSHVPGIHELGGELKVVKTFSIWQGKTEFPVTMFEKTD